MKNIKTKPIDLCEAKKKLAEVKNYYRKENAWSYFTISKTLNGVRERESGEYTVVKS